MTAVILVAGRNGQVARALAGLRAPDLAFSCVGRDGLDLLDADAIGPGIDALVDRLRPVAIVNAAAYTAVDRAEAEPDAAMALNRDAAGALARAAARHGLPFLHLSTDYVFSGETDGAYDESDATGPLGVYGRTKRLGEIAVAEAGGRHVTLRTAWLFGPQGQNFLTTMLRLAAERDTVRVVADQWGTPTFAPDLAGAIATVLRAWIAEGTACGLFHVVAGGETSWAGFAAEIFRRSAALGGPSARVEPVATSDYPTLARRPMNARLSTAAFEACFGHRLPPWQDGVARCLGAMPR